jgi:hypothetical protein
MVDRNGVESTAPAVVSQPAVLAPVGQPHQLFSASSVPLEMALPSTPIALFWIALSSTVFAAVSDWTPVS